MAMARMTLRHFLVLSGLVLPASHGMKQIASPVVANVSKPNDNNAMANTYGFLRKSNNNVGNAVESILGIENNLDDMHKDLDEEYKRWMIKKKVLLQERDQMKSETSRLKAELLRQKRMAEEKIRVEGRVKMQQAENKKLEDSNKEQATKWILEKRTLEEEIKALQCQTANIQRNKQERVNAANRKTSVLKDENRVLQQQVFQLNKELIKLAEDAATMKIKNKNAVSALLAQVEAVQKQIHGLETELVAQAQLEETVQRARERLGAQTGETVKQRAKITEAQEKCMANKKQAENDIEAAKAALNAANVQMAQCQNLDGNNQKLQATVNKCVLTRRSTR